MKKKMIALLLSIVMTVGNISGTTVLAAETTAEEAVVVEEETIEEATEIPEEADTAESVGVIEEDPAQGSMESVEEVETTEKTEAIEEAKEEESADIADTSSEAEEVEDPAVDAEEVETETERKDAALVDSDDIVDSGECGENVTWTLTGTGDNLTLTISGSGAMRDYDVGFDIFPTWNSYKSEIKILVIEDGVTIIGGDAFYGCTNLTNITIPDSVTGIKSRAFSHCSSLTSITIPDGVMSIGGSAFEDCTHLTDITIPVGITSIGYAEFAGCSSLTSISIPDSVTSIGQYAFSQCKRLTSITIPASVTSIGDSAFYGCTKLTDITIPDGVKVIPIGAFSGCSSLTSISIPDGVKGILERAFRGCSSLTSISIPDSVTNIGRESFYGCSKLRSINIPVGVTSIGWRSFYGCSSLTSITIPDNVTSIGEYVFYKCSSLTTITIPEHVTSIGQYAFYGCTGLEEIYFNGDAPTYFGNYCFNGVTANAYYIDNSTWTEKVRQNYWGNLTWKPRKDYLLTIYAYGDKAIDIVSGDNAYEGHTWLSIKNDSSTEYDFNGYIIKPSDTMTIGLWPDTTVFTHGYGGVFINIENWLATGENVASDLSYYTIPISPKDVETIEAAVPAESYYHNGRHDSIPDYTDDTIHNCTTFAVKMWNSVAGPEDQIEEDFIDVPFNYQDKIDKKNIAKYGEIRKTTFVGDSDKDGTNVYHINNNGDLIPLKPADLPINVKLSSTSVVVGKTAKVTVTNNQGRELSYESSNNDVATVTPVVNDDGATYGIIEAKSVGEAVITITAGASPNYYNSDTKTVTIKVTKAANSITASNRTCSYSAKAHTLLVGAKATGGTLKYKSNNAKVKVSRTGIVSIPAKFMGTVKITITAGNEIYNTATKTISITVPTKTLLLTVTSPSAGKMKITWRKNTVGTGYQIQYSTSSKFTSPKSVVITRNSTLTKNMGGLTKGKKYYVRIRTYKAVSGKKYYSAWSAAKTVTIKK